MLESIVLEGKIRRLAGKLRKKAEELADQESSKPASSALRAVIYREIADIIEEEFEAGW